MANSQGNNLLGVVILTRHGDRRGFYQSESSYTASETSITPLGTVSILPENARITTPTHDILETNEHLGILASLGLSERVLS